MVTVVTIVTDVTRPWYRSYHSYHSYHSYCCYHSYHSYCCYQAIVAIVTIVTLPGYGYHGYHGCHSYCNHIVWQVCVSKDCPGEGLSWLKTDPAEFCPSICDKLGVEVRGPFKGARVPFTQGQIQNCSTRNEYLIILFRTVRSCFSSPGMIVQV